MAITKPDMTEIWASGGAIVEPSDTKKQTGWTPEVPPHQWENWIQNRQDTYLAHVNERGIPEWDGLTNYLAGGLSYVQGGNGIVYKSVAASGPSTIVQDPTTDVSDTYWTQAFPDVGAFLTEAAGDSRYLRKSLNGSDIISPSAFRGNIGVFGSAVATVAAASTIDLTAGAPDTCQLTISGTGVSITGFTVATNRWFVVKMTGASNTLVNSASLVTGRGANIPVVAGDSFLMRSTAANTVEVVGGTFLIDRAIGSGQTLQDVTASRPTGTTFTNTTGRSIEVLLHVNANGNTDVLTITLGGVVIFSNDVGVTGMGQLFTFTVGAGVSYRVDITAATINKWSEIR